MVLQASKTFLINLNIICESYVTCYKTYFYQE